MKQTVAFVSSQQYRSTYYSAVTAIYTLSIEVKNVLRFFTFFFILPTFFILFCLTHVDLQDRA